MKENSELFITVAKDQCDIKDSNNITQIYGLSGILNNGNSCYMNSAIQALCHNYPLTNYLFNKKEKILSILVKNARKIFKDSEQFKIECQSSSIPMELRKKIQNPEYRPEMLTQNEVTIILNNTITVQLIRLFEHMWAQNCIIIPTSFRKIFCEARNKFFYGYKQHDAEEAYSCIIQKMQEELAEEKLVRFRITKTSVKNFLQFRNEISNKMKLAQTIEEKTKLLEIYDKKKKEMPVENMVVEAFREMSKYYGSSYSRITGIFSGFMHSSIICPSIECRHSSNKFEPFLHLSLPIPTSDKSDLVIEDCIREYCKEEILDEQNMWLCGGCGQRVKGIKKLQLWIVPPVLVIQLKRFINSQLSKDNRLVQFSIENFDVSSMISPIQLDQSKCYQYRLHCVINHIGHLDCGHYYTYCMDEDSGKWFEFNDTMVHEISRDIVVSNNAYLLFYIRKDLIE
jgi:ubiquitin C-terminal hydrolase